MSSTSLAHRRPHIAAPIDGSSTITLRDTQPRPEGNNDDNAGDAGPTGSTSAELSATVGVLRLRGVQRRTRQRVAWGADVVDNEGCGKKKSKICCIYHKPRRFDESSSDSDSDSDSGSTSGSDNGNNLGQRHHHHHGNDRAHLTRTRRCRHAHDNRNGSNSAQRDGQEAAVHHELHASDSEANAYERGPKRKS